MSQDGVLLYKSEVFYFDRPSDIDGSVSASHGRIESLRFSRQ